MYALYGHLSMPRAQTPGYLGSQLIVFHAKTQSPQIIFSVFSVCGQNQLKLHLLLHVAGT